MNLLGFLKESTFGSIKSVYKLALIIIPLMIIMEILKDLKILDKGAKFLSPVSKFYNISKEATFPLIVGLVFGLAYGAGVIIESAKESNLNKKDLYVLIIFLISCHSVFEDTLIFVSVGANGIRLLSIRITIAVVVSFFASKVIDKIDFNNKNL